MPVLCLPQRPKGTVFRLALQTLSPLLSGCAVPGWDLLRTFPGEITGPRDLSYSYTTKRPSHLFLI